MWNYGTTFPPSPTFNPLSTFVFTSLVKTFLSACAGGRRTRKVGRLSRKRRSFPDTDFDKRERRGKKSCTKKKKQQLEQGGKGSKKSLPPSSSSSFPSAKSGLNNGYFLFQSPPLYMSKENLP